MDLMQLPASLRDGIRIPQEDGRVVIVTPIGRVDFPNLKTPRAQSDDPNRLSYQMRLIWNWNNHDAPAKVDITKVLNPAIAEIAQQGGLNPRGWLKRADDDKFRREDETWRDGYGPGYVYAPINTRANNADGSMRPAPVVRDSRKQIIDASLVKAGYYARAVAAVYHVSHGGGKVCFGLEEVQLLAKGKLMGGSVQRDYAGAYDAVQGDTFEAEPPSQLPGYGGPDDNDDIPF